MTHLRGTQVILASQRLFEPMRKLCVIVDALHIAVSVIRLNRIEAKMGDYVANLAVQFPLEVRLGLLAPTTSIAWDRPVSGIDIGFFPVTPPSFGGSIKRRTEKKDCRKLPSYRLQSSRSRYRLTSVPPAFSAMTRSEEIASRLSGRSKPQRRIA